MLALDSTKSTAPHSTFTAASNLNGASMKTAKESSAQQDFYDRFFKLQDQILSGQHPQIRLTKLPADLSVLKRPGVEPAAPVTPAVSQAKTTPTVKKTVVADNKSKALDPLTPQVAASNSPAPKVSDASKPAPVTVNSPAASQPVPPSSSSSKTKAKPKEQPARPQVDTTAATNTIPQKPDPASADDIHRSEVQKERKRIESYFSSSISSSAYSDRLDTATEMCGISFNLADAMAQALRKYKHVSGIKPSVPSVESRSASTGASPLPTRGSVNDSSISTKQQDDSFQTKKPFTSPKARQVGKGVHNHTPATALSRPPDVAVSSPDGRESNDGYSPTALFSAPVTTAQSDPTVLQHSSIPIVRNTNVSPVSPQPQVRPTVLSMPDRAIDRWSEGEQQLALKSGKEGTAMGTQLVNPANAPAYNQGQSFSASKQNRGPKPLQREASPVFIKQEPVSPAPSIPSPNYTNRSKPVNMESARAPTDQNAVRQEQVNQPLRNISPPPQNPYTSRDLPLRPSRYGYHPSAREESELRRVVSYPASRHHPSEFVDPQRERYVSVYDELPPRPFRAGSVRPTRLRLERSRSPTRGCLPPASISVRRRRASSPLVLFDKYGNEYVVDQPPVAELVPSVYDPYEYEREREYSRPRVAEDYVSVVAEPPPVAIYEREPSRAAHHHVIREPRMMVTDRREPAIAPVASSASVWYDRPISRVSYAPVVDHHHPQYERVHSHHYHPRSGSSVRPLPPPFGRTVLATPVHESRYLVNPGYPSRTASVRPVMAPLHPERVYLPAEGSDLTYSRHHHHHYQQQHQQPYPVPVGHRHLRSYYSTFGDAASGYGSPVASAAAVPPPGAGPDPSGRYPVAEARSSDARTVIHRPPREQMLPDEL